MRMWVPKSSFSPQEERGGGIDRSFLPKWETQEATPTLVCKVMEKVRKVSSPFSF
jgi:hypothetical protein